MSTLVLELPGLRIRPGRSVGRLWPLAKIWRAIRLTAVCCMLVIIPNDSGPIHHHDTTAAAFQPAPALVRILKALDE